MSKKAVIIGINYKDTENALNGCINDAKNYKEHLKNFEIKLMTDESEIKPTKRNIEDSIKWLVENNKFGDCLFFIYSGHGSQIKDKNNDESDGKDEVIIPIDIDKNGFISDDYLFENMVSKIVKGCNLTVITDCCHSGTMIDLKYNI